MKYDSYFPSYLLITSTLGLNSTDTFKFTVITADDAINANMNFLKLLIPEISTLYFVELITAENVFQFVV